MELRRRTTVTLAALCLGAGIAAAATDVFRDYGLDRASWGDAFVRSLSDGVPQLPAVTAKLKAVPPAQRAAVVDALGAAARACFASPEFRERWKKEVESSLPDDLRPPRTAADIEASTRAEMEKGLAEAEQSIRGLQGDARKQAEAAVAEMRAQMKGQAAALHELAVQQAAAEKSRYDEARNRPPDPSAPSPDPRVALRKALSRFLKETSGVDWAAETREASRTRRFVKPEYERKPRAWKACYRAGREACEAARSYAAGWLAELK